MSKFTIPKITKSFVDIDTFCDIILNVPQAIVFKDSTFIDGNAGHYVDFFLNDGYRTRPLWIRFCKKKLISKIFRSSEEQKLAAEKKNQGKPLKDQNFKDRALINLAIEAGGKEEKAMLKLEEMFVKFLELKKDFGFQKGKNGDVIVMGPSSKCIHTVYPEVAPRIGPFELRIDTQTNALKRNNGWTTGTQIQDIHELKILDDLKKGVAREMRNYLETLLDNYVKKEYKCSELNKTIPTGSMIHSVVVKFNGRFTKNVTSIKGIVQSIVYEPSFSGDNDANDDINLDALSIEMPMQIETTNPTVVDKRTETPVQQQPVQQQPVQNSQQPVQNSQQPVQNSQQPVQNSQQPVQQN